MSTKSEILTLVRRQPLTINELTQHLGMTRNAVVLPLRQLESAGLIRCEERRTTTAGKPPLQYAAVPGTEDSESRAYKPFAEAMMQVLPDHLSGQDMRAVMSEVGRTLAMQVETPPDADLHNRVQAAIGFLNDVGAEIVEEKTSKGVTIQSYSCPLAQLTRKEACTCAAVCSFFSHVTGGKVREKCRRDDRLICEFSISA